jgi:hypothetical protein
MVGSGFTENGDCQAQCSTLRPSGRPITGVWEPLWHRPLGYIIKFAVGAVFHSILYNSVLCNVICCPNNTVLWRSDSARMGKGAMLRSCDSITGLNLLIVDEIRDLGVIAHVQEGNGSGCSRGYRA